MTGLLLGPVLRYADADSATVWVETDGPCEVEVLDTTTPTFHVGGHHYALVVIRGLTPGTSTPYEVRLDGEVAWPPPDSALPPSRISTLAEKPEHFTLVFGSCQHPRVDPEGQPDTLGPHALAAYAQRMATQPVEQWPDALLLLGDQVYADETSPATREWLATRRDLDVAPGAEVADFEEYTHLYREAWSGELIRWLMATVPTAMIFDDHDVRDDWNTSAAWRREMAATDWWRTRIRGGLASYWIYQHLGNLRPVDLDEDKIYAAVLRSGRDGDALELLEDFAEWADSEADGEETYRWSYRRDYGPVRLMVIDNRAGRVVTESSRTMVGDEEFAWIERNAVGAPDHVEHLFIASTLPWLLPPAISDLESHNEVAAARPGKRGERAERLRQGLDLEHWAAFRQSFDRLAALLLRSVRSGTATASVLSGDVHHSYLAKARYPDEPNAPIYQLTCSPLHNAAPQKLRWAFQASWWPLLRRLTRAAARRAGVTDPPLDWRRLAGPYFGNEIATLSIRGSHADIAFEQAVQADRRLGLRTMVRRALTENRTS
ncbi:phosphodiesterase/alkaline phosphatase D-like protein [Actinoalloteichus hymeniacidonis]|uniref:Phosphodiesterase/alkaline phosphatase D n=1 Tax=Actinoalloteichus hymeniacidonis TaxID=340345 RepID=A0AAC9MZX3_9PSEU|nr:alkaline phosphatase D family protein [Actinoalloteichus hymeniacidonis]AOS64472.1 phosphodiesterase/alkaline phosphatase D [Actinoalloteichus hymeniacidonis]MBB5907458.1 phosphodiesterase/alkaline phosphatase D-like protein [Actinoalloteichus hymeniacidonis]